MNKILKKWGGRIPIYALVTFCLCESANLLAMEALLWVGEAYHRSLRDQLTVGRIGSVLVSLLLYMVSFIVVGIDMGGSRKTRTEQHRRVAHLVWLLVVLERIGLAVFYIRYPESVGSTEVAGRLAANSLLSLAFSYPLIMGLALWGRNLSFRYVAGPEEGYGYGR